MRILFVCMGNICRSPTAEGVFRHLLIQRRIDLAIEVDSAGTHDYHAANLRCTVDRCCETAWHRSVRVARTNCAGGGFRQLRSHPGHGRAEIWKNYGGARWRLTRTMRLMMDYAPDRASRSTGSLLRWPARVRGRSRFAPSRPRKDCAELLATQKRDKRA